MSQTAPTPKVDVTAERLKSFIERVERLEVDKSEVAEDIKLVFAEAKSQGFNVPVMRAILRLRKLDTNDRQEQEALLDTYKSAIGMS